MHSLQSDIVAQRVDDFALPDIHLVVSTEDGQRFQAFEFDRLLNYLAYVEFVFELARTFDSQVSECNVVGHELITVELNLEVHVLHMYARLGLQSSQVFVRIQLHVGDLSHSTELLSVRWRQHSQ